MKITHKRVSVLFCKKFLCAALLSAVFQGCAAVSEKPRMEGVEISRITLSEDGLVGSLYLKGNGPGVLPLAFSEKNLKLIDENSRVMVICPVSPDAGMSALLFPNYGKLLKKGDRVLAFVGRAASGNVVLE